MARARFTGPEGITVRELKRILADCPELDDDGEEAFAFALAGNGHLSPLTEVVIDDDGSVILNPEFHVGTMEMLGTYADFFGMEPEGAEDDAEPACELAEVG